VGYLGYLRFITPLPARLFLVEIDSLIELHVSWLKNEGGKSPPVSPHLASHSANSGSAQEHDCAQEGNDRSYRQGVAPTCPASDQ
jgi:hypothetical protein